MIQQAMIFAIGALTMGLFGAFFLPAYKRRAVRLTRRQLELSMPLSMGEVVAERDAIRAEAAAAQRALEQKASAAQENEARVRAELGRSQSLAIRLDGTLTKTVAENADLGRNLNLATQTHLDLAAQQGAMVLEIHAAETQAERLRSTNENLNAQIRDFEAETQTQRASIAGLETKISGRDMQIEDLARTRAAARLQIQAQADAIAKFREGQLASEAEMLELRNEMARLRARQQQGATRVTQLRQALTSERDAGALHAGRAEIAEARSRSLEAELQQIAEREQDLRDALQRQINSRHTSKAALAEELQTLRLDHASLQGTLEALRLDHARLARRRGEAAQALQTSTTAEELAQLRKSISEIGMAMERLSSEQKSSNAPPPAIGSAADEGQSLPLVQERKTLHVLTG